MFFFIPTNDCCKIEHCPLGYYSLILYMRLRASCREKSLEPHPGVGRFLLRAISKDNEHCRVGCTPCS